MALFISTPGNATRHAVFAIERNPPTVVSAPGAAVTAIVEQFPWGPTGSVYTCAGVKDFIDTFAPAGMSHTGAGYMAVMFKAWPVLKVVRAFNASALAATCAINKTGPTLLFTINAKYVGSAGNALTATVAAASDGVASHFNLTVSVTGSTGTTTEVYTNLDYSAQPAATPGNFTSSKLIASITQASSGNPLVGTTSFSAGSDGTIVSSDYVGTQGNADKGIALLETDKNIDFVMTGDPGNTLRGAVNVGLQAHADYMTDRIAFINGNSGMTLAAAQTDVASYRSLRCCYIDNWAYVYDDTDGTKRLTPPASWAASVAANLSPSTSFSWKSTNVQAMMRKIVGLETARGDGAYTNEQQGICTLQQEDNGGYTFECAVNTNAPLNWSKRKYKRTRMGHYIAKAVKSSLRESVDSPNVPFNQNDEVTAVSNFLNTLKQNGKVDPNNLPHIVDYDIPPLAVFNAPADLASGIFTIPSDIVISSDQEKIFFSMNFGESVTVDSQL